MEQQRLDAIRARCEAATPGPWEAGRKDIATIVAGYESKWIYAGSKYLAVSSGYEIDDWDEVMSNAYFISHAREDIPFLLDEVERLTRERDAAVQDLDNLRRQSNRKCYACHYDEKYDRDVCTGCGYNDGNHWKWRGPSTENQSGGSTDMVGEAHD